MKGLFLKDFYMVIKYCRWHLLIVLIFILAITVGGENLFLGFFPCLLAGMIPATLLSYDEHSKWDMYCKGLPYKGAEVVSAKYLIGLCCQFFVMILTGIAFAVRMNILNEFDLREYLYSTILIQAVSGAASSLILPFLFKFGVDKGRVAYYCIMGTLAAGGVGLLKSGGSRAAAHTWTVPVICIVAIAVYAVSWLLSAAFYKKREV